jgi:hypothetical protein
MYINTKVGPQSFVPYEGKEFIYGPKEATYTQQKSQKLCKPTRPADKVLKLR